MFKLKAQPANIVHAMDAQLHNERMAHIRQAQLNYEDFVHVDEQGRALVQYRYFDLNPENFEDCLVPTGM